MSFPTLVVIAAMLATIAALVFGVASMVRDGEVGHLDSEHWMVVRVLLQVTAVAAMVGMFYAAT
jgi:Hypoxia induced protein conserved region